MTNFQIHKGDSRDLVFTITRNGSAVNLTGMVTDDLEFELRGSATVSKTIGSGIALTTPASGICTVTLSASDTASLTPGAHGYALRLDESGFMTTVAYGTIYILGQRVTT